MTVPRPARTDRPDRPSRRRRAVAPLCLAAALALGSTAWADSFRDDFSTYKSDAALGGGWYAFLFPEQTSVGGVKLNPDGGGVVVEAQSSDEKFALTQIIAQKHRHRLGHGDVSVEATFDQTTAVPWSPEPIAPVRVGLSGAGASVFGQVGVTKQGDGKGKLIAKVVATGADGEREIKKVETPGFGMVDGKPVAVVVGDKQIDLLVDGKSVIGGPVDHGIDLASDPLGKQELQAFVQQQKVFAPDARKSVVRYVEVKEQNEGGGAAAAAAAVVAPTLAAKGPPAAQRDVTVTIGEGAPVNDGIFGINNSNADANWSPTDLGYIALVKALGATHERYIGGSPSSFWDWQTGHYIPPAEITKIWPENHGNWMLPLVAAVAAQPESEHSPDSYAEFARKAGVKVQWMVNLTTREDDQPALMKHLKDTGVAVDYVELDNETYFWGGEFGGGIDRPQNYAKRVAAFGPTVRKTFPDATIGVVASENGVFVNEMHEGDNKGDPAFTEWNGVLMRPENRPYFDAFVLHHYVMNGGTLDAVGDKPDDLGRAFLTCPQLTLDHGVKVLADEYGGVPMWVTEYNVIGYYRIGNPDDEMPDGEITAADRWIKGTQNKPWNALYQAGFWVTAMRHPGAIGILNHHSVTNVDLGWGLGHPVSEGEADLTATGQMFSRLSHLAAGAKTMHPLEFGGNPALPNAFGGADAGALEGAALRTDGGAVTLVVINRDSAAVNLTLPSGVGSTGTAEVYRADEDAKETARVKLGGDAEPFAQGPMHPAEMPVKAGTPVSLPGFSLTVVQMVP